MTASGDGQTKTTVAAEHLRAVTERVLGARGVSAADARSVTDVLVEANLRGHDSHGVVRVPKWVIGLESGAINARCAPRVIRETANATVVDGDRGLGPVVAKAVRGTFRMDEEATKGDLFLAIDPGTVADPEAFLDRVEDLKADVRASRTAPGVAWIYLPGEPQMECRSNRLEEGIPIETDLLRELETLAGEAAA